VAEEPYVPEPSGFNERLIAWNGLRAAGFTSWEFLPGMRFGESTAWSRGGAPRDGAHEGLDICRYRTMEGGQLRLGDGARVPVIYPGEVVSIVEDFLGVSIFVAHEHCDSRGRQLHTIYGHLLPRTGLTPGSHLGAGDAVGTIADTSGNRRTVPPHLHLTMALIEREGGPERLDWGALQDRSRVLLLDPMMIMKG